MLFAPLGVLVRRGSISYSKTLKHKSTMLSERANLVGIAGLRESADEKFRSDDHVPEKG